MPGAFAPRGPASLTISPVLDRWQQRPRTVESVLRLDRAARGFAVRSGGVSAADDIAALLEAKAIDPDGRLARHLLAELDASCDPQPAPNGTPRQTPTPVVYPSDPDRR